MHACSLHPKLAIIPGDMSDYAPLAPYHYRDEKPVAVKAVFTLTPKRTGGMLGSGPAGVIVYCAPNPRVELRTIATNGAFAELDRQTQLSLINANIRCIARVIIEPRFRGIGLATRLVRETMPMLNVPIVESLGVMAQVNPFLERAGMQAFAPRTPLAHVQLVEAFSTVGIEADQLIDPAAVQKQIESLGWPAVDFLETRIEPFLKSHNTRRAMPPGLERTRYILHKLTRRPTYYIWRNPKCQLRVRSLTSCCHPEAQPKDLARDRDVPPKTKPTSPSKARSFIALRSIQDDKGTVDCGLRISQPIARRGDACVALANRRRRPPIPNPHCTM